MNTGWLFLAASVLGYGLWGILAKVSLQRGGDSFIVTIFTAVGTAIVSLCVCLPAAHWARLRGHYSSILPGILAGVAVGLGNVCLYRATRTVPVGIAYPVNGLYVAVTVLLAALILKESLRGTQILGIVFSIVAIVLLTRK